MARQGKDKDWKIVVSGDRVAYPCGLVAGDQLRLKQALAIKDAEGRQTGTVHAPGEVWRVLAGVASQPNVIWLREPGGSDHTWDNETILNWFERV